MTDSVAFGLPLVCFLSFGLVDRTGWRAGAWDGEPDAAAWIDEATGLECRAQRGQLGNWCGYVLLAEDHPWRRSDDHPEPEVHGGLTFEGRLRGVEGWWVGFDCAHFTDLVPGLSQVPAHLPDRVTYRTLAFVVAETTRLAAQAAAAEIESHAL